MNMSRQFNVNPLGFTNQQPNDEYPRRSNQSRRNDRFRKQKGIQDHVREKKEVQIIVQKAEDVVFDNPINAPKVEFHLETSRLRVVNGRIITYFYNQFRLEQKCNLNLQTAIKSYNNVFSDFMVAKLLLSRSGATPDYGDREMAVKYESLKPYVKLGAYLPFGSNDILNYVGSFHFADLKNKFIPSLYSLRSQDEVFISPKYHAFLLSDSFTETVTSANIEYCRQLLPILRLYGDAHFYRTTEAGRGMLSDSITFVEGIEFAFTRMARSIAYENWSKVTNYLQKERSANLAFVKSSEISGEGSVCQLAYQHENMNKANYQMNVVQLNFGAFLFSPEMISPFANPDLAILTTLAEDDEAMFHIISKRVSSN